MDSQEVLRPPNPSYEMLELLKEHKNHLNLLVLMQNLHQWDRLDARKYLTKKLLVKKNMGRLRWLFLVYRDSRLLRNHLRRWFNLKEDSTIKEEMSCSKWEKNTKTII